MDTASARERRRPDRGIDHSGALQDKIHSYKYKAKLAGR